MRPRPLIWASLSSASKRALLSSQQQQHDDFVIQLRPSRTDRPHRRGGGWSAREDTRQPPACYQRLTEKQTKFAKKIKCVAEAAANIERTLSKQHARKQMKGEQARTDCDAPRSVDFAREFERAPADEGGKSHAVKLIGFMFVAWQAAGTSVEHNERVMRC